MVMASEFDQRTDCPGWSFPSVSEDYGNMEKAFNRFNELVADPKVAKACLNMTLSYVEESGEDQPIRRSYTNEVTIAHYDHKATCFENFMSRNNMWESNREKRPGICHKYHKETPADEPKSFKKKIKLNQD